MHVTALDKVGVLLFEFVGQPQILEVHVFRTEHYSGEVAESEGGGGAKSSQSLYEHA